MRQYGPFGPRLKALLQKKSSRALPRKRRQVGSILAVKLGLQNAGEDAAREVDDVDQRMPINGQ